MKNQDINSSLPYWPYWFKWLLLLVLMYLLMMQAWAIWPFTIDDMYIPLRYAKNWANGQGIVWNVGEPPVEGYSNFSFLLLARVALSWGFDPVVTLKALGVVGLFIATFAVYAITTIWLSRYLALIPCFWLLSYKGELLWSVSGLEMSIYQALLCVSVYFICKAYDKVNSGVYLAAASVLMALASMTRPEGPVLMGLFVVLLVFINGSKEWTRWNRLAPFILPFLLIYIPYFSWHWHYYGRLFPNPIYCKGITRIFTYELDKHYLQLIWPFVVALVCAIPIHAKTHDRRHYFLWLPSVVYLLLLLGADPVVAFDNRLFLPAYALLLPAATCGFVQLLTTYVLKKDVNPEGPMYVIALIMVLFIPTLNLSSYRQYTINPMSGERLRQTVASWLARHIPFSNHIVLADSGLIPYQSDHNFIDSYCLNSLEMARMPILVRYQQMCEHVMRKQPEVIILTALIVDGKPRYTPTDACLASKLSATQVYNKQISFQTGNEKAAYRYELFSKVSSS